MAPSLSRRDICYDVLNPGDAQTEIFHKDANYRAFVESLGSVAVFGAPWALDAVAFDGSRAAVSSALSLKRSCMAGSIQGITCSWSCVALSETHCEWSIEKQVLVQFARLAGEWSGYCD